MLNNPELIRCELCGRDMPHKSIERHHLEPKKKHQKNGSNNVALTCNSCSDQIHQLFSNKELEEQYNTIEKLKSSPAIQKWIAWVRKANPVNVCMKRKKKR